MPPPDLTASTSNSAASYRPPRTTYTPAPSPSPATPPLLGATAIGRTPSLRSAMPPPDPPVILPSAEPPRPKEPASPRAAARAPSLSPTSASTRSGSAPYEPFLNHAPPPLDSWIEVETTVEEYRLIVRLPGFKRDGITLATKKRRILHLVADSWNDTTTSTSSSSATGAHFERRISFGYDADLERVRAEFDGEILRVVIPRRVLGVQQVGR
ncbi:hypothetical protein B0H12DRAFT_1010233 [Mycena haematopus]|nr:hypothetical protein B0H12DRAFT_1010233 [Mycena haematopus]